MDSVLFECLVGPSSAMGIEIMGVIGVDSVFHSRFIYSFILSCQTNQGLASLNANCCIAKDCLLDTETHNSPWRKM